jgi:type II secretory pathway pseudopilin PulG
MVMVNQARFPMRRKSGGFTYLSLIILVAIIGLVAASALKLGSLLQRSKAESELLEIGAAFSDALQSYADATPSGQPTQPPSLQALLKDPRFSGTRRHLRKLFVDPITGSQQWGVVYLGDKVGVLAVYSLSDARPIKIANFPERFSGFENKTHISEWKFSAAVKPKPAGGQGPARLNTDPAVPALQQISPLSSVGAPSNTETSIPSPPAPAAPPEVPEIPSVEAVLPEEPASVEEPTNLPSKKDLK